MKLQYIFCILIVESWLIYNSCVISSFSFEEYASELRVASIPGPMVTDLVATTDILPPDERLSILYRNLLDEFVFVPDEYGFDHFQSAEAMLKNSPPKGDCEDFCALIVAICRSLKINSRVVIGKRNNKGHAWVEVLLERDVSPNSYMCNRLKERFGNSASIINRHDGKWLQLSPKHSIDEYKVVYFIEPSGKLVKDIQEK